MRACRNVKWKQLYHKRHRHLVGGGITGRCKATLDYAVKLSRRPACTNCYRPAGACICCALPETKFSNCHVRLIILQHPRCQVNIGTVRLLHLGLQHCKVLIGTDFFGPHAEARYATLHEAIASGNAVLLFPTPEATDVQIVDKLDSDWARTASCVRSCRSTTDDSRQCQCGCPANHNWVTLIAVDGSWRHARYISTSSRHEWVLTTCIQC